MKKSIYVLSMILFCAIAAFGAAIDPTGFLVPEKAPACCPQLDHVHLVLEHGKLTGWMQMKDKSRYPFSANIQGKAFTFKTSAVKGTTFDFKGTFKVDGNLSAQQPSGTVLTGTLTRSSGGKRVSSPASFMYTVGD